MRFYQCHAYFHNLLESANCIQAKDRVICAVAQLFLWSLTTAGKTGLSAVLSMPVAYFSLCGLPKGVDEDGDDGWNLDGKGNIIVESVSLVVYDFLGCDFRKILSAVHSSIKGTDCICGDFRKVLKKCKQQIVKSKEKGDTPDVVLYYSDSPYAGTADYADDSHGVKEFSDKDMHDLIVGLTGSGSKFIFSCRAAAGYLKGSADSENLRKTNRKIRDIVIKEFCRCAGYDYNTAKAVSKEKHKLWVLAIEKSKPERTLEYYIQNNKTSEIMITNFEIKSFSDKSSYKNSLFKVYDFDKFLKIHKDCLKV